MFQELWSPNVLQLCNDVSFSIPSSNMTDCVSKQILLPAKDANILQKLRTDKESSVQKKKFI